MPPQVHGHHHLAIQVRDLAGAERFYTGVLGLNVVRRWPNQDGTGERSLWIATGAGDEFIALEACDGQPEAAPFRDPRAGLHLVALRILRAERAAWETRLQELGVEIVHRTRYTLYLRDPEGNRVGLSHFPHEA
jgi:catechol 2,3-dioxygenase-like lactoylglutathione lyase family enzyme